jgi:aspartate/methionine/tyrosine aminotransferase
MRGLVDSLRLQQVQEPIIGQVAAMMRASPGTISLGQGVVHYPPAPAALAGMQAFLANPDYHKYQHVLGVPDLLAALRDKMARENAILADERYTMAVTAGGNMAVLTAILAICDPGDEVILLRPYYFNHEMAVGIASARAMVVDLGADFLPDLDRLAAAITPRTRLLITVSPNNPSGVVYPASLLTAINRLCQKHGIFHLNDEAYEYFVYDGAQHFSPASLPDAANHTVTVQSFSKTYAMASWRVGCLLAPASLASAIRKIQDTNIICAPVISQFAALGALAAGPAYCAPFIAGLADLRRQVWAALNTLGDRLQIVPAQGAFYFLVRVNTPLSPMALVSRTSRRTHPRRNFRPGP